MRVKTYLRIPEAANSRPVANLMDLQLLVDHGHLLVQIRAADGKCKSQVARERAFWWNARDVGNVIAVLAGTLERAELSGSHSNVFLYEPAYKSAKCQSTATGETYFEMHAPESRVFLEALKGLCADMLLTEDAEWRPRQLTAPQDV